MFFPIELMARLRDSACIYPIYLSKETYIQSKGTYEKGDTLCIDPHFVRKTICMEHIYMARLRFYTNVYPIMSTEKRLLKRKDTQCIDLHFVRKTQGMEHTYIYPYIYI